MSSDPNTYLVASIKYPKDDEDFDGAVFENLDLVFITHGNEQGVAVAKGCFGLYTHITYGWGNSIPLEELDEAIWKFRLFIQAVLDKYNLTLVSIEIGADWF